MKTKLLKLSVGIALSLALAAAHAGAKFDSAQVVQNVVPLLNGLPVEKIMPSKHAGLYEILTPAGLFYTDKTGSFVIFGATIVDTKTKTNLTEQRLNEFSKFEFSSLPLQDAIKTVKGDGSRIVATIEDPNCGFCKKLMQEVAKLDNVTIYTFLVPILGADSLVKSTAIWCAKDPSAAWTGFMSSTSPLPATPTTSCNTPFQRNSVLLRKLRISGTPVLLFADNTKTPGYIAAAAIEAKLKK